MTGDWTYDTWVGFPQGFTVRDLSTLYDILEKALGDFDPEMYPWEPDQMDLPDVTLGEIRAVVAAVSLCLCVCALVISIAGVVA